MTLFEEYLPLILGGLVFQHHPLQTKLSQRWPNIGGFGPFGLPIQEYRSFFSSPIQEIQEIQEVPRTLSARVEFLQVMIWHLGKFPKKNIKIFTPENQQQITSCDSFSNLSTVLLSMPPHLQIRCPVVVDFPESTWPMTTILILLLSIISEN